MAEAPAAPSTDRRRLRGEQTRQAILTHASQLASSEGLDAVSFQRLATDLGISKSGLFAHFGSKEELQLATIEEAGRIRRASSPNALAPMTSAPPATAHSWPYPTSVSSVNRPRRLLLRWVFVQQSSVASLQHRRPPA